MGKLREVATLNIRMPSTRELRIALVEDDATHAELYSAWLGTAGFKVTTYVSGADFRRRLGAESVDVVVLDWELPDTTGLDLLDWLKHSPNASLPVVFLTGNAEESDVVAALRAGAEDYVAKPARPGELIARVEAVVRRSASVASEREVPMIEAPPFQLDPVRRRLLISGVEQDTTDREFELLAFMFRRAGRVISRELLLKEVWNLSADVTTRTVDTHISRLRKKLGLGGENGWRLSSVYLHGYRLERLSEPLSTVEPSRATVA